MVLVLAVLASVPAISPGGSASQSHEPPSRAHSGAESPVRVSSCASPIDCPTRPPRSTPAARLPLSGTPENHTLGWSEVASPPAGIGTGGGMIADAATGQAIVFGGEASGALVNTTFSYGEPTNRWSVVPTALAPSPRRDFAFAFDSTIESGVLFGGLTDLGTLAVANDTWEFNVSTERWSLEPRTLAPAPREGAAFAVSPSLGIALLFGGWNRNASGTESITYSDLWELNLTTLAWSEVTVAGRAPPPLEGAALLWDPTTLRFELFGGCYPCTSLVWEFDPTSNRWTEPPPSAGGPSARASASWAYDPTVGADLLFGGANGAVSFNDTYLFHPATGQWIRQTLSPQPAPRSSAAADFLDTGLNATWLVEGGENGSLGYSDLWRLSTTSNVTIQVQNASAIQLLSGARVNWSGRTVGTTDVNGDLALSQVDAVGSPLLVSDFGYFTQHTTIWLPPGLTTTLVIRLVPEAPGTVYVTTSHLNGSEFPGVSVSVVVNGTPILPIAKLSDDAGNASFYGVPPGVVNVTVATVDQRPDSQVGILFAGGDLHLLLTLVPDPTLVVTVLGRYPGEPLVPLMRADVSINGRDVGVTGTTGVLAAVTTAYGISLLSAKIVGFSTATEWVSIPWTGVANATIVLVSLPFGFVEVSVQSNGTNVGIPNASVTAISDPPLASGPYTAANTTDVLGLAGLSLPEGQWNVSVSAAGFLPSTGNILVVVPGSNQARTIFLFPESPAHVWIGVRDSSSGDPIGGADVSFVNGPSGRANGSGDFNTTVAPGTYTVIVSSPAYVSNSTTLHLAAHENFSSIVNLTPLPTVPLGGGSFRLLPAGLSDLWPFLVLPVLLVVGVFVYAAVLRATNRNDDAVTTPPVERKDPDSP